MNKLKRTIVTGTAVIMTTMGSMVALAPQAHAYGCSVSMWGVPYVGQQVEARCAGGTNTLTVVCQLPNKSTYTQSKRFSTRTSIGCSFSKAIRYWTTSSGSGPV